MGKKKKKYNRWIGGGNYELCAWSNPAPAYQPQDLDGRTVPEEIIYSLRTGSAFLLGLADTRYIGIPKGTEGNFMIAGGNGSGKSSGIIMPTLRTFDGAICATDIKGELSEWYGELFRQELVNRPYIIFDPTQVDGPAYDPFWWVQKDDEANLVSNIREIVTILLPVLPDDNQPFWAEAEQSVFSAALLHYFKCGLSFSETILKVMKTTTTALCREIQNGRDTLENLFLGEITNMKPETLANIDRGLRNKLVEFAADPYISHIFRGTREGANCFSWEDLDHYNIFLRIPATKIEQWGGAINLMYTQLIRYLERRPDQYSAAGEKNIQTLLLMDELPRFGKIGMLTSAMATLRSKNVNICLAIQSIAQLDKIYGEYDRRIIFDNCQYQVILRANDADTQKYLCELIGTSVRPQHSISEHMDEDSDTTGYSRQISEVREFTIQPHELAKLNDVLLLTPYGFFRVEKFQMQNEEMKSKLFSAPEELRTVGHTYECSDFDSSIPCVQGHLMKANPDRTILPTWNKGVKMMSIQERSANADRRALAAEQQQRRAEQAGQEAQERKDRRRNFIIGELVTKYFPDVLGLEPGNNDENVTIFEPLEAFLYVLSTDFDLFQDLKDRAAELMLDDPAGEWHICQ